MDELRKRAYRMLLYHAMLYIRPIGWAVDKLDQLNPLSRSIELRRIQIAGELADCLHNLAESSALDFKDFNEDWFWKGVVRFEGRGADEFPLLRAQFDRELKSN